LRWWPARITVAIAYTTAIVDPLARNDALTLAVAGMVAVTAVAVFVRTSGTARRAAIPALAAALAFAAVLALTAINRLGGWQADRAVLWTYDLVVAGVAVILLADLLYGHWSDFVVTGLVVDLGTRANTGTLQDELRRALGDRSLVLGYWLDDEAHYVDEAGHPLDLDQLEAGRAITPIVHDGLPLAVLVHDAAVLGDRDHVTAVAAAARLAVSNVRLQADTRQQVAALIASRRRIIDTTETQRRQLEQDLHEGVEIHLAEAAASLRGARSRVCGGPTSIALGELEEELRTTRAELDTLAQGLHPRLLTDAGLAAALRALPAPPGTTVGLAVTTERLSAPVEAAIYFVCSEALTNVAKHAAATHATITVMRTDECVVAEITDNGIGGADPARGSGLRGLTDRVEAVGGELDITSRAGSGTVLTARIPNEPYR
jgi:signal transduction histidine kinase